MSFVQDFEEFLYRICEFPRYSYEDMYFYDSCSSIIKIFGGSVEERGTINAFGLDPTEVLVEFKNIENICENKDCIVEYLRWITYLVDKYQIDKIPSVKEDKNNYIISFSPMVRRQGKSRSRRITRIPDISFPKEYLVVEKMIPDIKNIISSYYSGLDFNLQTFENCLRVIIVNDMI